MDELVMTIAATARETRVLLMHGPDEVMKARLRAVATPAHRFAGPMLCESMALWHDQRVRGVVSAESEDVFLVRAGFVRRARRRPRDPALRRTAPLLGRPAAPPRSTPVGSR
jgi:hypothetical protein